VIDCSIVRVHPEYGNESMGQLTFREKPVQDEWIEMPDGGMFRVLQVIHFWDKNSGMFKLVVRVDRIQG
jgi:hypothetical protein